MTTPLSHIVNLAVSRGDFYMDSTGGTVTTTETVIGTVSPFIESLGDRIRLDASVLAKAQITATTKGSQGGVSIEFRLRKDSVSGTIIDTKVLAISHTAPTMLLDVPVVLFALDVPGAAFVQDTRSYVLTAKKVLGTNITATAEWDEAKFRATGLSA